MKINEYINNLGSLRELNALLSSKPEATVTFWGARVIKVPGYEGSITLDALSHKVLNFPRKNRFDDENGKKIMRSLKNLYWITDDQVKKSNFFTRTLNGVRDLSLFDKPPRIQLSFLKEHIEHPQIDIGEFRKKGVLFAEAYPGREVLPYIENILADESFRISPKAFMEKWKERRGNTEEFRYPEDAAHLFFERELHM